MLGLPNFGHMTTSIMQFDVINFVSKYFILRRPRIDNFADIIKNATMFIKKIFKNSKKLEKLGKKQLRQVSSLLDMCEKF